MDRGAADAGPRHINKKNHTQVRMPVGRYVPLTVHEHFQVLAWSCVPNRRMARSFPFSASMCLKRGGAWVTSERMRVSAARVVSSMAFWNAASFALDGFVKPLSLRTN